MKKRMLPLLLALTLPLPPSPESVTVISPPLIYSTPLELEPERVQLFRSRVNTPEVICSISLPRSTLLSSVTTASSISAALLTAAMALVARRALR